MGLVGVGVGGGGSLLLGRFRRHLAPSLFFSFFLGFFHQQQHFQASFSVGVHTRQMDWTLGSSVKTPLVILPPFSLCPHCLASLVLSTDGKCPADALAADSLTL